jgi:hypothetical protein
MLGSTSRHARRHTVRHKQRPLYLLFADEPIPRSCGVTYGVGVDNGETNVSSVGVGVGVQVDVALGVRVGMVHGGLAVGVLVPVSLATGLGVGMTATDQRVAATASVDAGAGCRTGSFSGTDVAVEVGSAAGVGLSTGTGGKVGGVAKNARGRGPEVVTGTA